jgi:hypothetical protein
VSMDPGYALARDALLAARAAVAVGLVGSRDIWILDIARGASVVSQK